MKRQIRYGVFETNSSSTHSLTMCNKSEYDDWKKGKTVLNENWNIPKEFPKIEDVIEYFKREGYYEEYLEDKEGTLRDNDFYTHDNYFEDDYAEVFESEFKTPSGDVVVAFGKVDA